MISKTPGGIELTVFGESHSKAIGAVLTGIPAGEGIDYEEILRFMKRRAPGQNAVSTPRKEDDEPIILSGINNGTTTGTPIAAIIENKDTRSKDYDKLKNIPRPSHADFPAFMKYGQAHDHRGGGHFSGRLTAPLCFAGAVCSQILRRRGIEVFAHIGSVGEVEDIRIDKANPDIEELRTLKNKALPVLNDAALDRMIKEILKAGEDGDSVGGTVECCISGLQPGLGDPLFEGIENRISRMVFAIPAVKGIEFGNGFESTRLRGSENNDPYYIEEKSGEKKIKTRSNNSGGILGGLSTGMPIIFKTAFKPTPSIGRAQDSVDMSTMEEVRLEIAGRHDPCVVPRATPCVEAAAMIAVLDLIS